ncbi:hypothetical protein [uncultured Campylobacter sp.]|uniref:hypothetical protein n=1 Tax=uncultured Campylobacter sp. TaxID=218934 RepID=UPI0028EE6329|nr:hypothetical protein [uncultured Campylobacter sp.]
MIERKPSEATLARAVNLSPINSPRKTGKFATDFYGKFNDEPLRAAAKSVKFKNKAHAKTLASPQIKFDLSTSPKRKLFSLTNLTAQTARTANQMRVNLTSSGASKHTSNLASNLTKRH